MRYILAGAACAFAMLVAPLPAVQASAAARKWTTVPIKLARSGEPLVEVICQDGKPATLALDTGSVIDCYTPALAARLHAVPAAAVDERGNPPRGLDGAPIEAVSARYWLAGALLPTEAQISPAYRLGEIAGEPVDGILGARTLLGYAVLIDLRDRVMRLMRGGVVTAAERGSAGILGPLYMSRWSGDSDTPTARVELNGLESADLLVDTGSSSTVLDADLARPLRLRGPATMAQSYYARVADAAGVLSSLTAGPFTQHGMVVDFPRANQPVDLPRILGRDFLAQYRVLIDYPTRTVCLAATGHEERDAPPARLVAPAAAVEPLHIEVAVPSHVTPAGNLIIEVPFADGSVARMGLSSVTSECVLKRSFADRHCTFVAPLKLQPGSHALRSPSVDVVAAYTSLPVLLGGVRAAAISDGMFGSLSTEPVDGVLGSPPLSQLATALDSDGSIVRFIFPGGLSRSAVASIDWGAASAEIDDCSTSIGLFQVAATFSAADHASAVPDVLAVDTMPGVSTLSRQLALDLGLRPLRYVTRESVYGPLRQAVSVVPLIIIGTVTLRNVEVRYPLDDTSPTSRYSSLGRDALRGYRMLIDWPAGKFYLFRKASAVAHAPRTPALPAKRVSRRL